MIREVKVLHYEFNYDDDKIEYNQACHFILNGLYFGYPPCCIQAFIRDTENCYDPVTKMHDYSKIQMQRSILRQTYAVAGYVPCEDHAVKLEQQFPVKNCYPFNDIVLTKIINYLKDSIDLTRICPISFPVDTQDLIEKIKSDSQKILELTKELTEYSLLINKSDLIKQHTPEELQ